MLYSQSYMLTVVLILWGGGGGESMMLPYETLNGPILLLAHLIMIMSVTPFRSVF